MQGQASRDAGVGAPPHLDQWDLGPGKLDDVEVSLSRSSPRLGRGMLLQYAFSRMDVQIPACQHVCGGHPTSSAKGLRYSVNCAIHQATRSPPAKIYFN